MSPIFGRIAALLLVWSLVPAPAQAGSLTLVKSVDSSTSLTGASITFTINYTCPGITGDCTGVVIKDVLPTGLNYVGIVGDGTNTTSSVYTTSNRTATWTMKTPLTAGTTGSVKLIACIPGQGHAGRYPGRQPGDRYREQYHRGDQQHGHRHRQCDHQFCPHQDPEHRDLDGQSGRRVPTADLTPPPPTACSISPAR